MTQVAKPVRTKSGRFKLGNQPVTDPETVRGAPTESHAPTAPTSPTTPTGGPTFEGLDPFSLALAQRLPKVRTLPAQAAMPPAATKEPLPTPKPPAPAISFGALGKALAASAALAVLVLIVNRIMSARREAAQEAPPQAIIQTPPAPSRPNITYL